MLKLVVGDEAQQLVAPAIQELDRIADLAVEVGPVATGNADQNPLAGELPAEGTIPVLADLLAPDDPVALLPLRVVRGVGEALILIPN